MDFFEISILGNTILDYLTAFAIIVSAILIAFLANHFLRKYIYAWVHKTQNELDDIFVKRVFPPLTFLIFIVGVGIAKSFLSLPEKAALWLDKILVVLGYVVFFIILIRLVQGLVEIAANGYVKRLEQKAPADLVQQTKNVERIKKQVREIANMVLAGLAILTILSTIGVNLKAVWASLGIGGIALALAVQEPLRNLVGRIYIFSTGIFDEGHFIVFNGWAGTVREISAFRTYMELFADMTTVSIPNADFVKGAVKTYYGRTTFMYKWDLDVPYNVSPGTIQDLISRLRELLAGKAEVNQSMCWIYLQRLDKYSKVVRVWFQAKLPNWSESLFYGNQALHDIQLVFESMGIPFAFPTQTLELKTDNPFEPASHRDTVPAVLPELEEDSRSQ
jgi:MscS family membrane protein